MNQKDTTDDDNGVTGVVKSSSSHKRNLDDLSRTASMDMVAINNLIVSFRGPVKKARVHVIHQLTRKAKLLQKKKGSEEIAQRNREKAERLHQEIKTLTGLDVDKVAKFALSNTTTFNELMMKQPNAPMTTRAMTRLASTKELTEHVHSFRTKHEDWKELANFILYKNTGRRYRKNKTKRKEGEAVIRDMIVSKLKGEKQESETNDSGSDSKNEVQNERTAEENSDGASDSATSDEQNISSNKEKCGLYLEKSNATSSSGSGARQNVVKSAEKGENQGVSSKTLSSGESDRSEDESDSGCDVPKAQDKLAKRILGIESSSSSSDSSSMNNVGDGTESTSNSESSRDSKTDAELRIKGDIVVRKLNLNEFHGIEVQASEKPKKAMNYKPKSSFFMGAESGESDEMNEDTEEESEPDQMLSREDISKEQTSRGRDIVESVFLPSLSHPDWSKGGGDFHRRDRGRGGHGSRGFDGGFHGHSRGGRGSDRGGHGFRGGRGIDRGGRVFFRGDREHNRGGRGFDRGGHEHNRGGRGFDKGGYGHSRGGGRFDRGATYGRGGQNRGQSSEGQEAGHSRGEKTAEASLHPSWEASRKRKEASSIQTFTGKKIKFDE